MTGSSSRFRLRVAFTTLVFVYISIRFGAAGPINTYWLKKCSARRIFGLYSISYNTASNQILYYMSINVKIFFKNVENQFNFLKQNNRLNLTYQFPREQFSLGAKT